MLLRLSVQAGYGVVGEAQHGADLPELVAVVVFEPQDLPLRRRQAQHAVRQVVVPLGLRLDALPVLQRHRGPPLAPAQLVDGPALNN